MVWENYFKKKSAKSKKRLKKKQRVKSKAIAGANQKLPAQDDGAVVQHVVEEGEKFTCEETGREERRWTSECDVKESPGEYQSHGLYFMTG